jgi:hypothetical protein
MRRTLAAVALLVTVAAAPVAGLPKAFAQAPSMGGLDVTNALPIDAPGIGAHSNQPADVPALSQLKSSPISGPLPINMPAPRVDIPSSETPASQPEMIAAPTAPSEEPVVSRAEPEVSPAAAPTTRSVESVEDTPAPPSEPPATQEPAAGIPGVTTPIVEPVPERQAAQITLAPTPSAFGVPEPAWISTHPRAETVVEEESAEVVEDAAPTVSEPAVAEASEPRDVTVVSLPTSSLSAAFVPPVPAARTTATTVAVAPAAGEEGSPIVADAATTDAVAVQATQPAAELPRASSPAPAPILDIPTLASIEMPGGLHLSMFAALFGALGSAALGLHLLLRRIESTL